MHYSYKQVLITLVSNLNELRYFSEKLSSTSLVSLSDKVLQRIETGVFSVAVVGEFKRGKSTFINALLGQEILPSDVLPATATLNRVVYGSQPFVKIQFRNGQSQSIAIEQLSDYVTKLTPEAEGTAATVEEAVIHYPVDYCQHQIELIDTPGLCDDEAMTAVTLSVLRQVELVIVVTSVLAPFAESEGAFLTEKLLSSGAGRIIFIATGIDQFNHPEKANRSIQSIQNRIKSCVQQWSEEQESSPTEYNYGLSKLDKLQVFGLSAYQALAAKQNGDTNLLVQSRFTTFEAQLQRLLIQERETITLQANASQVITIATEVLQVIHEKKQILASQIAEFDRSCDAIKATIVALQESKTQCFKQVGFLSEGMSDWINPILHSFEQGLKQAVENAIDSTDTSTAKKLDDLNHLFADRVVQAVQFICQNTNQEIQNLVKRKIAAGIQQFTHFVALVSQFKSQIEQHLNQLNTLSGSLSPFELRDWSSQTDSLNYQTSDNSLPNLFPVDAQLFLMQADSKGVGTTVGVVAGALFFGPLGAAIGGTIGAGIGNQQLMRNFKSSYKSRVLEVIEQQLKLANNFQKVENYVKADFYPLQHLKTQIDRRTLSLINGCQTMLAEVQGKHQAVIENRQEELNRMQFDTQKILEAAQGLSKQLSQNMETYSNAGRSTIFCKSCNHKNAFESNFCIKCGTRLI